MLLRIGIRGAAGLAVTVVAMVAASTACSSSSDKPRVAAPACKQPAPPDLPHAAGQVSETDSGAFCLGVGQRIDSFLSSPDNTDHWSQIKSSDTSVLLYGDTSVLTTPVSVTAGIFIAQKTGTAVLSSALADGKVWSVTIIVR